MSFLFDDGYYKIGKNGVSPFQNMHFHLASAMLGLVGQPRLQKYVQKQVGATGALSGTATNLVASAVVSPIYVFVTNPLSRLEVITTASPYGHPTHWLIRAQASYAARASASPRPSSR